MATKKTVKAATKKVAPKKSAAASTKTTVKRVTSESKTAVQKASVDRKGFKLDKKLPGNLINIVLAEVIGTFILTMVALYAASILAPLYIGITLMLIVMAVGAISGAHVNPAVTFGLWTMRKVKTVVVPFYFVSQFLGAMAAVVLIGALSGGSFAVHFDHFTEFSWSIFAIELIGMAIFMFGIAAAVSRSDLKAGSKAVAVGMSLTIALIASSTLLPVIQKEAAKKLQENTSSQAEAADKSNKPKYPHELYVSGATLNPAVAVAVSEWTDTQAQSSGQYPAQDGENLYSRLSGEVILATLIGAALGGNLFLLVNYRNKTEE